VIENNRIHEDIREISRMTGVDFALDVRRFDVALITASSAAAYPAAARRARGQPPDRPALSGPAVRTASLLEQREFELPVLFVLRGAHGRPRSFSEVSALKLIRE
jgi:hypothetical protein